MRPALASRFPVHVTVRLGAGLPSLRRKLTYPVVRRAFRAGRDRFGFRLNHYSVQNNHIHLLVEATDSRALSRGMQGLLVRVARAVNRAWERKGKVFADRFHGRILRTPREVRNTLAYVLQNARRHRIRVSGADPFSSGVWFDGWRDSTPRKEPPEFVPPFVPPRTWLLSVGWRRHGRIPVGVVPGTAHARP